MVWRRLHLSVSRASSHSHSGNGISRRELQERLDKDNLHLDRDYIGKLYDEIMVERTKRMDRRLLALSSFEDTMTEVVRLAWEIANTPYISAEGRVMALREIPDYNHDRPHRGVQNRTPREAFLAFGVDLKTEALNV
jgi:hypothetical protein